MSSADEFYFQRKIDHEVLRETEKAMLCRVNHVNSSDAKAIVEHFGWDIMYPIELWLPKSWFKFDNYDGTWHIWEKGLLMNLTKLGEKRMKNITTTAVMPESDTVH